MEKLINHFSAYGIPGLALFVFLVLYRRFKLDPQNLTKRQRAFLAFCFLLLVSTVTIVAMFLWRPNGPPPLPPNCMLLPPIPRVDRVDGERYLVLSYNHPSECDFDQVESAARQTLERDARSSLNKLGITYSDNEFRKIIEKKTPKMNDADHRFEYRLLLP